MYGLRLAKLISGTVVALLAVALIWGQPGEADAARRAALDAKAPMPQLIDAMKAPLAALFTDPAAVQQVTPQATGQITARPVKSALFAEDRPAPVARPPVYIRRNGLPVLDPATPAPAETADAAIAYVTATRVNFRDGPGTDQAVIDALTRGEAVTAVGTPQDGWQRIRIEGSGGEGWIAARFLSATPPG